MSASAQATPDNQTKQEPKMSDLLKMPGKIVSEGSNTVPSGIIKLASYRVEKLSLPQAVSAEIGGRQQEVREALRITLKGGPFQVRALPPVIWIDETAIGYGVENEDLNEITTVTFDQTLLHDGATFYLSYGDKENKRERVAVPEKLKLEDKKSGGK
jgi:hypothetical protein